MFGSTIVSSSSDIIKGGNSMNSCVVPLQRKVMDMPELKKRVYIICPVRRVTSEVNQKIEEYVHKLEGEGYEVYWPYRDTTQTDPTGGFQICGDNGRAIYRADEIHIWWDRTSEGSRFDLGMLFMCSIIIGPEKRVLFLNKDEATLISDEKGFEKVIRALEKRL